jgi:hypothetical protein
VGLISPHKNDFTFDIHRFILVPAARESKVFFLFLLGSFYGFHHPFMTWKSGSACLRAGVAGFFTPFFGSHTFAAQKNG